MIDRVITGVSQDDIGVLEADADDGMYFEVVDGVIVAEERGMTWYHFLTILWLYRLLDDYAVQHKLGRAFPDGGRYILRGIRDNITVARQPDASFLRAGRIPPDFDPSGDFEGAPDLAIEVASPKQSNPKLLRKISDYLEAGTEEAWLIDPKRQLLFRFRRDMDGNEIYKMGDSFETPLFPGLIIRIADIFNGGKTQVETE